MAKTLTEMKKQHLWTL